MITDGIEQAWPGTDVQWRAFLHQRCRCGHERMEHVGHIRAIYLYGILEPLPWGESCRGERCACADFQAAP